MLRRAFRVVFLCALLALTPQTFAAEWVVGQLPAGPSLASILTNPLLADGDIVRVPSGTYDYTGWSTIAVSKRIALVGDGQGISIIKTSDSPPVVDFLRFTNDFSIRGLTLAGFDDTLVISAATASTFVLADIRDIEVTGSRVGVAWNGGTPETGGIRQLVIEHSRFHNLSGPAIRVEATILDRARVVSNDVENVVSKGIALGADVLAPTGTPPLPGTSNTPDRGWHYVVSGNHIKNVHAADPLNTAAFLHGILLYGEEAVVTDNIIQDVRGANTDGRDQYPGIYTQCRRTVITGNVLRDVGPGYAIDVKGGTRSATSGAQGFSALIANNQVYVDPGTGGTSRFWNGIKTDNEDASIHGNHVEVPGSAIFVQSNAVNDISIVGNMIFGGWRGIDIKASSDPTGATRYVLIANNHIVGVSLPAAIVHNNTTYSCTNLICPPGGIAGWVVGPNIIR